MVKGIKTPPKERPDMLKGKLDPDVVTTARTRVGSFLDKLEK